MNAGVRVHGVDRSDEAQSRAGSPGAGIGLRPPHYRAVLDERPGVGWVEVHSENYFGRGGQPLAMLERVREIYPVSLHGVGMSLGSADGLSREHLAQLDRLVRHIDPMRVSDHLCWGAIDGLHLNDLLPLPYTEEALEVVCRNVAHAQDHLRRRILVENLSSYAQFSDSSMAEWDFLAQVALRTGCAILLDVNNIYVSSINHGFDPLRYLDAIPARYVEEIHLAGFERAAVGGTQMLIDTHGSRVAGPVWNLYGEALSRLGPVPTLIEWDSALPKLEVLVEEARQAQQIMEEWRATDETDALAA